MHWRCIQGASSRWRKRQPEKLGCRQWRVWPTARWDDWWRLNGGSIDQERGRRVCAVPGTAARYREELGNPARRLCIVCAPVPAANEGWWAHQWCGRRLGALQMEDQPCRRVQHRLESAQEVGWDVDQHAVAVVQWLMSTSESWVVSLDGHTTRWIGPVCGLAASAGVRLTANETEILLPTGAISPSRVHVGHEGLEKDFTLSLSLSLCSYFRSILLSNAELFCVHCNCKQNILNFSLSLKSGNIRFHFCPLPHQPVTSSRCKHLHNRIEKSYYYYYLLLLFIIKIVHWVQEGISNSWIVQRTARIKLYTDR